MFVVIISLFQHDSLDTSFLQVFLGYYPACYIFWPTFRNTLSVSFHQDTMLQLFNDVSEYLIGSIFWVEVISIPKPRRNNSDHGESCRVVLKCPFVLYLRVSHSRENVNTWSGVAQEKATSVVVSMTVVIV